MDKYLELVELLNEIAGEKHKEWRMSRPRACNEYGHETYPMDMDRYFDYWNVATSPPAHLKIICRVRFKSKEVASIFKLSWEG